MLNNLDILSRATLLAIIADQAETINKAIIDKASAQCDADDYYEELSNLRDSNRHNLILIDTLKQDLINRDNDIKQLKDKYEPKVSAKDALETIAKEFPYNIRGQHKIGMIKRYRELTGAKLKEAKDAIEGEFWNVVFDVNGFYVKNEVKPYATIEPEFIECEPNGCDVE